MTTLLQRATQHDDNAEGKWLWSGKGDRRRIVGGIAWLTWGVGIEATRDWDTLRVVATLGPFALAYIVQRPHVWHRES